MSEIIYDPRCFNVTDLNAAKRIILTPEEGLTTNQRWERETPYLADLILNHNNIDSDSVVLDFGCGVGRMSNELIKRTGCRVIGADISASMRALAAAYVDSDRFTACHPDMLGSLRVDVNLTISIWVLQHVRDLTEELSRIHNTSSASANLFVVNEGGNGRVVPTTHGWKNDGVDMREEISNKFTLLDEGKLSADVVTQEVSDRTFWANYSWTFHK